MADEDFEVTVSGDDPRAKWAERLMREIVSARLQVPIGTDPADDTTWLSAIEAALRDVFEGQSPSPALLRRVSHMLAAASIFGGLAVGFLSTVLPADLDNTAFEMQTPDSERFLEVMTMLSLIMEGELDDGAE